MLWNYAHQELPGERQYIQCCMIMTLEKLLRLFDDPSMKQDRYLVTNKHFTLSHESNLNSQSTLGTRTSSHSLLFSRI